MPPRLCDERIAIAMRGDVDSRLVEYHLLQRDSAPGLGEVQRALVTDLVRHVRDEVLEVARLIDVVGVGLVPLEHRELGIVLV